MLNETRNIANISCVIEQIIAQSKSSVYLIIDGDRTLIPSDSTKFFFEYLNLDFIDLKNIFQMSGYTFEAFYKAALFYSNIEKEKYDAACVFASKSVEIYSDFLSFIHSLKDIAEVILITAGIKQIWQNIIHSNEIDFIHIIGGNYFPEDLYVVDKNAKGIIAKALTESGKTVFAFGDTLVDYDMLRYANHSYLVVNEKMNKDIAPFANEIPHLKQISFSGELHANLDQAELSEIYKLIKSCSQH
jgi:hypothetical protein